jgi:hypothetical protein
MRYFCPAVDTTELSKHAADSSGMIDSRTTVASISRSKTSARAPAGTETRLRHWRASPQIKSGRSVLAILQLLALDFAGTHADIPILHTIVDGHAGGRWGPITRRIYPVAQAFRMPSVRGVLGHSNRNRKDHEQQRRGAQSDQHREHLPKRLLRFTHIASPELRPETFLTRTFLALATASPSLPPVGKWHLSSIIADVCCTASDTIAIIVGLIVWAFSGLPAGIVAAIAVLLLCGHHKRHDDWR